VDLLLQERDRFIYGDEVPLGSGEVVAGKGA
jgi:hypothetical protein